MTRTVRLWVFLLGAAGLGIIYVCAFVAMPDFGGSHHLYRDLAVPAAVSHSTANVVSSVNFDLRGLDTLGEETILLGSVVGVATLLRPAEQETERRPPAKGRSLDTTRLVGYVALPVTLIVGFDLVIHGQVTPGGGFQGGVALATGWHLVYVTGSYPAFARIRPLDSFEVAEAFGAMVFAVVAVAGLVISGAVLTNFLPFGTFGQLLSAGTVPVLNIAVGIEVTGAIVLLLAKFLEQDILVVDRLQGGGASR